MNINIKSNNDNNICNMTRVKKEKNSDRAKERKKIVKNGDHWPGKNEKKISVRVKKRGKKQKTSGDQVSAEENRRLASMLLNFALSLKTDWKIELLG